MEHETAISEQNITIKHCKIIKNRPEYKNFDLSPRLIVVFVIKRSLAALSFKIIVVVRFAKNRKEMRYERRDCRRE